MKYAFLFCLFLCSYSGFSQDTLRFINLSDHDYELKKFYDSAKVTNKKLLIYFSGDGCAPCLRMQKEVFTDPKVIASSDHLIPLKSHLVLKPYPMPNNVFKKVNKDHLKLGKKLDHNNTYPTFYILHENGDVLARKNAMSVDEFIEFIKI